MPYYPKNLLGATGMANSTPVVIATNQITPTPTILNIPVNGQTGATKQVTGTTFSTTNGVAGATAISAVGVSNFLHITSFQFTNFGSVNDNVNIYFGSGAAQYPIMQFTISPTSTFMYNFATPLRAPVSNSFLWFSHNNTNNIKSAYFMSAQGFKDL